MLGRTAGRPASEPAHRYDVAALEAALSLAVSSARASQKARCVMKLSLLLVRTDVVSQQAAATQRDDAWIMDKQEQERRN